MRKAGKRDVALKIVRKSKLTKMENEMVHFEINILSKLRHRNVVRILFLSQPRAKHFRADLWLKIQFLECFESHKNFYISFELAAGGELFDRIVAKGGKFTERDAKSAIR